MAKKEKKHSIEHQIINLEIEGVDNAEEINDIQQNIVYFFKQRIGTELEKLLDKIAPEGVEIQIDNLEMDLSNVAYSTANEMERELLKSFKNAAGKQIREKVRKLKEASKSQGGSKKFSKMEILEFFFKNGYYPAWASAKNGAVSDIFDELMKKKAKDTATRLFRMGNDERVRERLYQQLSLPQLELLFEQMYGENAKKARKYIKIIQKSLGKKAEKGVLSAAINYVLKGGASVIFSNFKERDFTRHVIEDIQNRKITDNVKTKVRAGFEGTYRDIQILEYFLEHGAIPSWANVDSKKSFQDLFDVLLERELVSLQRMIERHINNANFTQRLIYQFSTPTLLKLITPTPSENVKFIEDSLSDFEFLTSTRQNITKSLSKNQVRTTILSGMLDYFFLHKKTNFVKKTFLKSILEDFSQQTQTNYTTLIKESYKSVRRKKKESSMRATLEQLDGNLQEKLISERVELRQAKKEHRQLERELDKLKKLQEKGSISAQDLNRLRKASQEFKKLEKIMEELEDSDRPLEIELLLRQRQELKNQLQRAEKKELEKIQQRLENTEQEFRALQAVLKEEVKNLIRDKKKLKDEKIASIAETRIKRVNNRLSKYQRAVQNIITQLKLDQQDITLFLGDINKALRGDISNEEKRQLRTERTRLQKELLRLNEYIEELKEHEVALQEALETALAAVDGDFGEEIEQTGVSKLDALIFMLQYGATPWWAENFPRQTIEELFLEFAAHEPQKLRKAFHEVGKYPVVWQRTINQLSEKAIREVLTKLFPTAVKVVFAQAELLSRIHYAQAFPHLNKVERKKFQWASILEYMLNSKQSFSAQEFNKEITLETARLYNLPPSELLEYTNNLIQNKGGDLKELEELNKALAKDKKVAELERDLIAFQRLKEKEAEGRLLDDNQKLELLVEFISTGSIPDKAKEYQLRTIEDFEDLLLEQIQKNRSTTRHVVFNLIRLTAARQLIVKDLSEATFWEIVDLVRPKALLLAKRHLVDFKRIFGDKDLLVEKDVLLNFFLSQQQESFEPIEYIKALLLVKQQQSGRQLLPLLGEWKRKIKLMGNSIRSSCLMSVIMLEIEALKLQQQKSNDTQLRVNLREQLEFLAQEYTETSKIIADALVEESAEVQGLSSTKEQKLEEINEMIQRLENDLETLKKETGANALESIANKRKVAQLEAQIKLLNQKRPPLLRKIERKIESLKDSIQEIGTALEKELKKGIRLENETKEEAFTTSLIERQNEMIAWIKARVPTVFESLPLLLEELKDEDNSNHLFVKDLIELAKAVKDESYRKQLLTLLHQWLPSITTVEALQKEAHLDEQQKALLAKIDQTAPIQLWKEWEALQQLYKANPSLKNKETERLQQQIYKAIKRIDKRNLLAYASVLRTAQEKIERELDLATTVETLEEVQEKMEVLQAQQVHQVDEMIAAAPDEVSKNDYKRLRRNLAHIFTKIKNKRIRKSNALISEEGEDLRQDKFEKEVQMDVLEQKKEILTDEIRREEASQKEEPVEELPKKRKKKAPVPKKVEEPLVVYNAGMVLLWPYFTRLFDVLKYTEKKAFVSVEAKHKAIHILQYLVTGKTEAPENELLLNKLMCNYPLTEPVPFGVEFTEQELQMAEGLLKGVINNWPKMKTMSPGALRGSFLVREGTLEESIDKWVIKVQKKPFDILLKTLPWGFNFIKLPWTEKFIAVEWQLF